MRTAWIREIKVVGPIVHVNERLHTRMGVVIRIIQETKSGRGDKEKKN